MKSEEITKLVLAELESLKKENNGDYDFSKNLDFMDEISDKKEEISSQISQDELNFKELYEKNLSDEIRFLNSVKERILVLFEGLSNFDKGDIEARVELNLKFIEFLLANIETRLENL